MTVTLVLVLLLVLAVIAFMSLSWVIEGAVRRGVSRALQDNRDWLSGQGGSS
jgi:hypothetical protein